ncbi:MAG: T9SS type A sorting domain-containing protein [Cyclobacteriaceae bacterium]
MGLRAQTGPGGVGNEDGAGNQPENVLWLDASWLGLSDGDAVQTWTDRSNNGNDAVQSTASRRPAYVDNMLNGLPVIRFDNTGSQDCMPFDGSLIANTDYTVIIVAARRSTGGRKLWMGGSGNGSNLNLHAGWNNTNFMSHHYSNDFNSAMTSGAPGTTQGTFGIFVHDLGSTLPTAQRKIYQNGTQLASRNSGDQLTAYDGAALARAFGIYYDVDIAEMILFSDHLTQAQRTLIDNYLSAKYDIAISNDRFTGNGSTFVNDIAGIGYDTDGAHEAASSAGLYLSSINGSLDTSGEYLITAHDNTTNGRSASAQVTASGATAAWARQWYVEKTLPGGGSIDARLAFDFREGFPGGEYPQDIDNYVLLYRNSSTGNYSQVAVADKGIQNGDQLYFDIDNAQLLSGYYTIGTTDETDSPIEGAPGTTLYTYQSGNWASWENWTFDPDGSLLINPDNLVPGNTDNVVILNGRDMVITQNGKTHISVDVQQGSTVNLGTTSGHNFGIINGKGRIRLASDELPAGDLSEFADHGTVEFRGSATESGAQHYDLAVPRELFNVEINLVNSSAVVNLMADYKLGGTLTVRRGILKIGDDTSTEIRTLELNDIDIQSQGSVLVGTGNTIGTYSIINNVMPGVGEYHNIFHQVIVNGDFTNNGLVRFTNLSDPIYNEFAGNGAATVRFRGSRNATATLNSTTDFYNLVLEKGSDKTYELDIYAAGSDDFALYGPNSVGRRSNSPFTGADPEVRKALWIRYGTLKLSGNVYIPTLSEGADRGGNGDYAIGSKGALWIAGTGVEVYSTAYDNATSGNTQVPDASGSTVRTNGSNQALSIYGRVRISDGYLSTRNSAGLIFWSAENGEFIVEGGVVDVSQCRAASSGSGKASYIQSGGTVYVRGNEVAGGGEISGGYGLFNIETTDAVFNMSGGTLYIEDNTGNDVGGIEINSAPGSYNVTGGKVIVNVRGNTTCEIASTANFYDFELRRRNTSNTARLELAAPLVVTNDVLIDNNTQFRTLKNDLYVGGDLTISNGGSLAADSSAIILNGSTRQNLVVEGTLPEDLFDLRFDGSEYHLSGANASLQVTHLLEVNSGELELGHNTLTVIGNIINSASIRSSSSGKVLVTGGTDHTIGGNGEGAFPGLEIDESTGTVTLTASQAVRADFTLTSGIVDLGIHNLTVNSLASNNIADYDDSRMVRTAGNGSDGGLSVQVTGNGTYVFPLGTQNGGTNRFTPASVDITNYADDGYITVAVGDRELPTLVTPLGDALSYYWSVRPRMFATLPRATFMFTADDSDDIDSGATPAGFNGAWVPGFVQNVSPFGRTSEAAGNISGLNITFDNGGSGYLLEAANFTAGQPYKFAGSPTIYYSRRADNNNGFRFYNWNNNATWSTDPVLKHMGAPASGYPQAGDVAVIGYGNVNQPSATGDAIAHRIDVNGSVEVSALIFDSKPGANADVLDLSRLRFDHNESGNLGLVSGVGDITLLLRPTQIPALSGDFGDFVSQENSMFAYNLTRSGTAVIPNTITNYPQIRINGNNNFDGIIKWQNDITARYIVVQLDALLEVEGNLTVTDTLRIGNNGKGYVRFPAASAATYDIGRLMMDSDDNDDNNLLGLDNSNSGLLHQLVIRDGIELNDGTIDLFTNNTGGDNVQVTFTGSKSQTFTNTTGGIPELHSIIADLDNGQADTLHIQSDFTLNADASLAGDKPLSIQSGMVQLDHAGIDITLSNGGGDFVIPRAGGLIVTQGIARITSDGYGLELDGLLRIESGGQVLLDGGAGTDTYLEYSNTGTASLQVAGGNLVIGSQLRRFTEIVSGILDYQQTGGTVVVGKNAAPESDRGVFEIINSSSNFTFLGGSLTLVRQQNSASVASLYLDPGTSDLSDAATIYVGNGGTPAGQSLGIYSSIGLKNLVINDHNTPGAYTYLVPLTIENDFTIMNGATYDARGLDLTIGGDMTNDGFFVPNDNVTIFNGTTQTLTGDTEFYNVQSDVSGSLSLAPGTAVTVTNDLNINSGTLTDNGNLVTVQGDITLNGQHNSTGSGGILLQGDALQRMAGRGIFGEVIIDNINNVQAENNLTFSADIVLRNGSLDLRDRRLTLQSTAGFRTEGDGFSADKMIITNGSQSDGGIIYPVASGAGSYTLPLGVAFPEEKYLPVELDITANPTPGTLHVVQVNNGHPTAVDPNNVLQYYYEVVATDLDNAEGSLTLNYSQTDVLLSGSTTEADYIPARLVDTDWFKFPETAVDEANNTVLFTLVGNDLQGIFTAGSDAAIPDQVITFTFRPNTVSNWNDQANWSNDNGLTYGVDANVPANGPSGAIVVIPEGSTVFANGNLRLAHRTRIDGELIIGDTFGHDLGEVSGTGVLSIGGDTRATLPAGDYSQFFSCTGGGLEYTGSVDVTVSPEAGSLRTLIISGSGTKTLPYYGSMEICEELRVESGILDNSTNDNYLRLYGDLTVLPGASVQFGSSSSRVYFSGTSDQQITGDLTGDNAIENLYVSKSSGDLILNDDLEIDNSIRFEDGVIQSSSDAMLIVNSSGNRNMSGSADSYVDGPMGFRVNGGTSRTLFPVGKNGRYTLTALTSVYGYSGDQLWTIEYYDESPVDGGLSDELRGGDDLAHVSGNEYWRIEGPTPGFAKVRLSWDDVVSEVSPDEDVQQDLVVAEYTAQGWQSMGGNVRSEFNYVTATATSSFSVKYFTIGSVSYENPLPVTLVEFSGYNAGTGIALDWTTATERNNDYFEVQHSSDGTSFRMVGLVDGSGDSDEFLNYSFTHIDPSAGANYYRLRQVDYNGDEDYSKVIRIDRNSQGITGVSSYPNPSFSHEIKVSFTSDDSQASVRFRITDMTGRQVIVFEEEANREIDLSSRIFLKTGIYIITAEQNGVIKQNKFVIR